MSEEYFTDLEFLVTICLGRGDGGDVTVHVPVTEEEYNYLKENEEDLPDDLYNRIVKEAIAEDQKCMAGSDEVINYEAASYMVELLDDIFENED